MVTFIILKTMKESDMWLSDCNRCFECNEELSTHCNKKALAQTLDFLQKQSAKATTGKFPAG